MGLSLFRFDSENITWNLDLDLIESLITPKTKAIIPVHLFGHPVDMDHLMLIAQKHNLVVIEDCAEAHGATCRDRMVGGFGDMGCFSFYANKIITTGEGGMVTTNDDKFAERLRLLRNLAFTTPRFRHDFAGYNFRMTGYQAALGLEQFRKIEVILQKNGGLPIHIIAFCPLFLECNCPLSLIGQEMFTGCIRSLFNRNSAYQEMS